MVRKMLKHQKETTRREDQGDREEEAEDEADTARMRRREAIIGQEEEQRTISLEMSLKRTLILTMVRLKFVSCQFPVVISSKM